MQQHWRVLYYFNNFRVNKQATSYIVFESILLHKIFFEHRKCEIILSRHKVADYAGSIALDFYYKLFN